ncbi:uncharacterized protein LOC129567946 [Sitodiplosis mosellana]|uniref:uncharacterized protein LOC129567946 n=1 Tax=Sitodiplosis mosellana TaxID=263140 RepID=UPI00244393AE|nr:uncharacterized protein LOC129567946 [Sitodiplosis mosellana]
MNRVEEFHIFRFCRFIKYTDPTGEVKYVSIFGDKRDTSENEYRSELNKYLHIYERPQLKVEFLFVGEQFLKDQPPSNLDPDVKKFLTFILRAYMPFGVLSMDVFPEADHILEQCNDVNKEEEINKLDDLIPKNFVPRDKIAKREMLDRLKRITETLLTGIRQGLDINCENRVNALEYFYSSYLDITLTSVPHHDEEYNRMKELINIEDTYGYVIEHIFKVKQKNGNEMGNVAATDGTKQLFHGTYPNNILGILKEGLHKNSDLPHVKGVDPSNRENGDGIYFTDSPRAALGRFRNHLNDKEHFPEVTIFYCTVASAEECYNRNEKEYVARKKEHVKIDYVIKLIEPQEQQKKFINTL